MTDLFATEFDMSQVAALFSESSLAARWNKSVRTVQRLRAKCEGPPWFSIGRSVFYRFSDILDFEMNARHLGGS